MKLNLILIFYFGFLISINNSKKFDNEKEIQIADRDFLQKQKFLLEIVYRIGHPLAFEEWISFGKELIMNKDRYIDFDDSMLEFYDTFERKSLLPQGEFFGSLVNLHRKQALELFKFFYNAKDWDTFMRNVCWARIHINEGMFVYSLTLSILHRKDLNGLMLPSIQEIIPEYFFHEKFIFRVAKFNLDNWKRNNIQNENVGVYICTKEWKIWQWWRLLGLKEKFYQENLTNNSKISNWLMAMYGIKSFWMPLDYTRDIEVYNEFSKLSYFAEDVHWNSYWYYMNLELLEKPKTNNILLWFEKLQQIMARYNLERLSQGFGEIENFSWEQSIRDGYDSQLYCYNGVGFSYRRNNWKISSCKDSNKIQNFEHLINEIFDLGFIKLKTGKIINFNDTKFLNYLNDVLLETRNDHWNHNFLTSYMTFSAMYFGAADDNDLNVFPNVFMNYETMIRDPMFYIFYKNILQIYFRLQKNFPSLKQEEINFPGIKIENVEATKLMTFFNFVDYDVSTLLNDEMKFNNFGQFQWNIMLKGRQMILDHKTFHFDIKIDSDKNQNAIVRIFLGPKYDEFGRIISFEKNHKNFMKFDEFSIYLNEGKNYIKRNSTEMLSSNKNNQLTYTELYHHVIMALNGDYNFKLKTFKYSRFPDNLILPRGWSHGMPVQLLFIVTDDMKYSYNYPFDRDVSEKSLLVSNIYLKNSKIYHEDILKMYTNEMY